MLVNCMLVNCSSSEATVVEIGPWQGMTLTMEAVIWFRESLWLRVKSLAMNCAGYFLPDKQRF